MAATASRDVRRSLPVILALLLALFAGASMPHAGVERAPRASAAAVVSSSSNEGTAQADPESVEDEAPCCVPADRARVLRTQLVVAVRAARAPPAARL